MTGSQTVTWPKALIADAAVLRVAWRRCSSQAFNPFLYFQF